MENTRRNSHALVDRNTQNRAVVEPAWIAGLPKSTSLEPHTIIAEKREGRTCRTERGRPSGRMRLCTRGSSRVAAKYLFLSLLKVEEEFFPFYPRSRLVQRNAWQDDVGYKFLPVQKKEEKRL